MQDWRKKLKFVAITAAFAVLILVVLTNVVKMTQVSDKDLKTYEQGLVYLEQQDFENAYFNFVNVSKNSAIYEIALLRQALCADELKDFETATQKYRMFIEKYPESIFIQKAHYALAQNYFREKDYPKSEKIFNAIKRNFKDSEYTTAANYYLGLIYSENPKNQENAEAKIKAKDFFVEYLKNAPDGRFALNSVNEILKTNTPLSQNDNYLIGKVYLKNGQYKTALDSLNKTNMASSWASITTVNLKLTQCNKSAEIFENGYSKYSKNIDDKELHEAIEAYATCSPLGLKNGFEKALNIARENDSKGGDFILYRLIKYESDAVSKLHFYKEIYEKYPNGRFASDALAQLFRSAYKNRHCNEAMSLGQIHLKNYPNTIASPSVMFWMGKIAEKQGLKNESKGFYQRILEKYPDDYYAYRAARKLSLNPNSGWKTKASHRLPENEPNIPFPIKHTKMSEDNLPLINAITRLKDYSLLGETEKSNKAIQSWLFYKEGKFATSALLARDFLSELETKPLFSDSLYKLAYQLHYQEFINDNAKHYKLDPFLIAALIREESYYNPKAGSSVGAIGLMQLMPTTASYIATRKGYPYNDVNALHDPDTNITLGCAYLDYAKEKLHGNDLLAVASYNGGPNAVRSWRENLNYSNFDEFIENIPYPETKDYVKKVYRSYWVYLNAY